MNLNQFILSEQEIQDRGPQSVCYPLSVSTHHIHKDRMEADRERGRLGGGETRRIEVKDGNSKKSAGNKLEQQNREAESRGRRERNTDAVWIIYYRR